MQADIKLLRSFDGGTHLEQPAPVNQDVTNADQFQPYVRVTPTRAGQRVVLRPAPRPADPPNHPGNFFIDTFLARSNNARPNTGRRPGSPTTRGIRRSTRRSRRRASSSATTRAWSPTTASRSRSSTTRTWPTTRPRPGLRPGPAAQPSRRSSPGGCPTRASSVGWQPRHRGAADTATAHGYAQAERKRTGATAATTARLSRRAIRRPRTPRGRPAWPRVTAPTARIAPGRRPRGRRPVPCLLAGHPRVASRDRLPLLLAVGAVGAGPRGFGDRAPSR